MQYYRPLIQSGDRPDHGLVLAGGWCWFDRLELLTRQDAPRIVPASAAPADVLARLTAPRGTMAGVPMNAPQIMGILNTTPDSFSDGGRFDSTDSALHHALAMVAQGGVIIDIGGESTRPGAVTVAAADEIARVVPAIGALRQRSAVAISVDTRKAAVAHAALAAGASMINDVSALCHDPDLAAVIADARVPVCLMHAQGDPATMQDNPTYNDVLLDVYDFLAARIAFAQSQGIARERIIVDPGIGFGKTLAHNLALMRGIALFHSLGCPVLLGASRKRFIGTITGAVEAADRTAGSVAAAQYAAQQGVQILRVHDTLPTKQALDLLMALM
jgi:dihydropteroate synthase